MYSIYVGATKNIRVTNTVHKILLMGTLLPVFAHKGDKYSILVWRHVIIIFLLPKTNKTFLNNFKELVAELASFSFLAIGISGHFILFHLEGL